MRQLQMNFLRFEKKDVLKDPNVDFVHINSPIPDHAPMSIAALKAGKHVMCTVPMATTVEECKIIVQCAGWRDTANGGRQMEGI